MKSNEDFFFSVKCDKKLLPEVLEDYNKLYKTDFEIVEFNNNSLEVVAKIRVSQYQISDIFSLGFSYGSFNVYKNKSDEIDW
jgi:hypothetical protein